MDRLRISLFLPGIVTNFALCMAQQAIYQANVANPIFELPMGLFVFLIGAVIIVCAVGSFLLMKLPTPEEKV